MNQVILIGRLTRDPDLSYTPNTQTAVCRFDIAVNRPRRNGEDAGADYPRITVWGKQAENCGRYLAKGRQVAVQGRLQTGSYKNREGVTVYTTEVVASNVEFLGSGQGDGQRSGGQSGSYDNSYSQAPRESGFAPAQDAGYGQQSSGFGGFDGFDDLPDTFQAAEDDIPF